MKKIEEIIAQVFNINSSQVTNETSPENTEEWDSFNGLLLITELEKEFGIKFSIEEMIAVKDVGDIKKVLRKNNISV
jgi:acyl carrier protein